MNAALAALAAAGYAASDVTAALVVRRLPAAAIALWGHVVAAAVLLAVAVVVAPVPPAGGALAAVAGGLIAGLGAVAYYTALGRGPASLLAPLAASGLTLPVLAGVLRGERGAVLAAVGTATLLAGIALLSAARDREGVRLERAALALALAAAATFGTYFLVVDAAVGDGAGHPLWVAGLVCVGSAVAALPVVGLRVAAAGPPREALQGLLAVGAFLAVADLSLALALDGGDIALVSVIASSDPALTVVAARLFLGERVSARQAAGIALALGGLLAVAAA
jgi:drug/metabolite transporter (DMT)-like permease